MWAWDNVGISDLLLLFKSTALRVLTSPEYGTYKVEGPTYISNDRGELIYIIGSGVGDV